MNALIARYRSRLWILLLAVAVAAFAAMPVGAHLMAGPSDSSLPVLADPSSSESEDADEPGHDDQGEDADDQGEDEAEDEDADDEVEDESDDEADEDDTNEADDADEVDDESEDGDDD